MNAFCILEATVNRCFNRVKYFEATIQGKVDLMESHLLKTDHYQER